MTPLYSARATEAPKCLATITAFMEDSTPMGTEYVHKTHTTEYFKTTSLFPSGEEHYIVPTLRLLSTTAISPTTTVLNLQSYTIKHTISRLPLSHLAFYAPKIPLIIISCHDLHRMCGALRPYSIYNYMAKCFGTAMPSWWP